MEPFITHKGIVAPIDRANIDTDAIIPKQFLRKIERTGFGKHLFHEWRYLDYEGTQENPDFILNQEAYREASILLTRENFGCGSSREHAPWALSGFGIKSVISASFADIFYNNALKNGILLIKLSQDELNALFEKTKQSRLELTINLQDQTVSSQQGEIFSFKIDPFVKDCMIKGLDPIDWTLQFEDKIIAYENLITETRPWFI